MATQVGEGYIEIEPRFNRQMFNRMMGQQGRESAAAFNRGFERGTRNLTNNLGTQLQRGFARGLRNVDKDFSKTTHRIRRNINEDGRGIGTLFGRHFAEGFSGVLSLLPARLERLFTSTGPVAGTAFFTAFAAAVVIGMPALGAMISGLLFAGIGFGAAIAAAVVGAAKDPRVSAAFGRLKEKFMQVAIFDDSIQFLGAVLARQLDKVTAALSRWAPHIQGILKAGAKFMPGIFDTMIAGMSIFLKSMNTLTNSNFMAILMKSFNSGLLKVFDAFAISFHRFLGDAQAMEGARMGLDLFFNLLASGIKLGFDFLRFLSRMWVLLAGENGGLDRMRSAWKGVRETIGVAFTILLQILTPLLPMLKDLAKVLGVTIVAAGAALRKGLEWFSNFLRSNPAALTAISALLATMAARIVLVTTVTKLWAAAQVLVNLVMRLNPIGLIITAIQLLVVAAILVVKHWSGVSRFFRDMWKNIQNWFNNGTRFVSGVWSRTFNSMRAHIVQWAGAVRGFIVGWLNNIQNWFTNVLRAIRNFWTSTWGAIKLWFFTTLRSILSFVISWNNRIANFILDRLRFIFRFWVNIWTAIFNFVRNIWNRMFALTTNSMNTIRNAISRGLSLIRSGWNAVWTGIHGFLSGVWRNITNAVRNGMNAVIGIINRGIDFVNQALGRLGVSFRVTRLGTIPAPVAATRQVFQGHASGGRINGPGSPTSDSIPAMLSKDEYVIRASSAKRIGYSNLDKMNRMGPMGNASKMAGGYAGGGRVGAGNNQLLNEHRDHVHVAMMQGVNYILAMARKSGIPHRATSTFRPGDPLWHGKGKAVDFGGFNQDAFASYWLRTPGVMELIHRTRLRDYAIFGGKGGGGGGGGIFGWLGKGWNWVLDHILRPAGNKASNLLPEKNALMGMGKGFMKTIFNKVVDKAKVEFQEAEQMAAQGDPMSGPSSGNLGSRAVAMQALSTARGMGANGRVILALFEAGLVESGMRNLNYGDRDSVGFLQQRPSMGWPSPMNVPIATRSFVSRAMAAYARGTRGTAGQLAQFVQRSAFPGRYDARRGDAARLLRSLGYTGAFDNGGILPPGGTGINLSGKPEMVLNAAQGAALENRISSGNTSVEVYIDGVAVAHRAVVRNNNAELVRALRTGVS